MTVIALAEKGTLLDPGPCMYMEKMAVGPDVNFERIGLQSAQMSKTRLWPHGCAYRYSVRENFEQIAMDLEKPVSDITVLILDRPRHEKLIRECREAGARSYHLPSCACLTLCSTEFV